MFRLLYFLMLHILCKLSWWCEALLLKLNYIYYINYRIYSGS